jgi:hypothetical protein
MPTSVFLVSTHLCCDHDDLDSLWPSREEAEARVERLILERDPPRGYWSGPPGSEVRRAEVDIEEIKLGDEPVGVKDPRANPFVEVPA